MTQITVFTGFLGAGKTTIILHLLSKLPKDYKVAVLKNEFGTNKVDSELLKDYQVQEMLNGCLCCVLVGQMKNALLDIQEKYQPDRIIIETSGSAFPAPIALQVRELPQFHLDSIITVVDCVNFKGYEDTSYTAKMQAKYTDLILLNKWDLISERELDLMLDHVYELNAETPKVKFTAELTSELIFGLDTKLFSTGETTDMDANHHQKEIDIIQMKSSCKNVSRKKVQFQKALCEINDEDIYRIKGFVKLDDDWYILNWAFGRYTLTESKAQENSTIRLTVMGKDLKVKYATLCKRFCIDESEARLYLAK